MRRRTDQLCMISGLIFILIGIFTLVFPEVSFRKARKGIEIPGVVRTYETRTIVIPRTVSLATLAFGGYLLYNATKIKKRGA